LEGEDVNLGTCPVIHVKAFILTDLIAGCKRDWCIARSKDKA
jgi:hypothetical protein